MAFYAHHHQPSYEEGTSFGPIYRLETFLDNLEDLYRREVGNSQQRNSNNISQRAQQRMVGTSLVPKLDSRSSAGAFVPKFDFRELADKFELYGELPGISKEAITIDFEDNQTIIIKGKAEHNYDSTSTSSGASTSGTHVEPHKPTVEEVDDDEAENERKKQSDKSESSKAVTTQDKSQAKVAHKSNQSQHKFWLSERSVGEFHRTFHFPSPVDLDSINASLKDGILTIIIPKIKKLQGRRITVN